MQPEKSRCICLSQNINRCEKYCLKNRKLNSPELNGRVIQLFHRINIGFSRTSCRSDLRIATSFIKPAKNRKLNSPELNGRIEVGKGSVWHRPNKEHYSSRLKWIILPDREFIYRVFPSTARVVTVARKVPLSGIFETICSQVPPSKR